MTRTMFSWGDPLPDPGTTTVLEASAGTGKTFAIAGLVARFVTAGVPLDQILAVTFSRRATAELRDGIRARLVRTRESLLRVLDGKPVGDDPVDQVIAAGEPAALGAQLARIEQAVGQVDAAPILTLHTFAKRMLSELGLLADHDQATTLGSDLDVLADEVIADVYLAEERWHRLGWEYANLLGHEAIRHPAERLHPPDPSGALRVDFATRVRSEFDRRKRVLRVLDYDDMISRLAATLADPVTGPAAARVLGSRFRVVLVDEFQDTDPQQWAFLEAGFHGRSTMMLIGDPKQAIYRFRGGDIETYTSARESANQIQQLGVNHRSDQGVVRGIEMLFGPVDLGTPAARIEMTQVSARHTKPRIRYDRQEPAEVVRVRALDSGERLLAPSARAFIRTDLLSQVDRLLDGSHELRDSRDDWRKVNPRDIAVLVSTNRVGQEIHRALTAAGHSAVFSGDLNVFSTDAALDWLSVLEALETPDRWHLRRAMMSALIGSTSADLAAASGDAMVEMTALLTRCARLLVDQGVAAVFELLVAERRLYSRLLGQPGGEALVSDLRHIVEMLNQTQSGHRLTPSALTEHLRRRIERAQAEPDERTRRLPTDRPAIRVMTVHQAKGLQFPIVLLPQAADLYNPDPNDDRPLVGHVDGVRVLDVAVPRDRGARTEAYAAEQAAESLRSFYVACTRAQSLLVMWWASTRNTDSSPLHRLLMNTNPAWAAPDPAYPQVSASMLATRRFVSSTIIDTTGLQGSAAADQASPTSAPGLLDVRVFDDHIDRSWTRTSYTGLTAAVHGQTPTGFEAETDELELPANLGGEPVDDVDDASVGEAQGELVSALAPLPGGTQFGSLVHAVLETVDPAAADLSGVLGDLVAGLVNRFPLAGLDAEALVEGLGQTLTTPLGTLTGGQTLRDLGTCNRLAELDFELPLGSGRHRSTVADLATLFDTMLAADDPLHRYGRQLANSAAAPTVLAGFLTGSIDVVLQVPGATPRFVVLDYKTNRMPTGPDEVLTAWHYSPARMTTAMCEAHYPLQALLYCVALHRYLGWRLPGYEPARHLGGVGYLFVRGMIGAQNPMINTMPSGVFTWFPPAQMIVAASGLLAGGL